MSIKECGKCNGLIPVEDFGKNASKEDGLQDWCRSCLKEYKAARKLRLDSSRPDNWKKKTLDRTAYSREYMKKRRLEEPEYFRDIERRKYEKKMRALHGEDWVPKSKSEKFAVRKKTTASPLSAEDRRWRRAVKERVRKAVLSGRLVRMPCEVCGELDVEAHHADYDQPLSVVWLCKKHHFDVHHE